MPARRLIGNVTVRISLQRSVQMNAGFFKATFHPRQSEPEQCQRISGGGIENELSLSFEDMVIDNEIYGMIARVMKGVEVTDQTMAVEVIKEVGQLGGNFLSKTHTKEWARKEMYLPKVSDRLPFQLWVKNGSKDVVERAKTLAREIIENHQVPPLPEHVHNELGKILKAAEKEKVGSGN